MMTYPTTADGLRSLGRSAIHPPANFAKLAMPSETPSMIPSATGGAPMLAKNAGRIAVAVSCPQSENKLPRPSPSTPRVNQCFERDDELDALGSITLSRPGRPYHPAHLFRLDPSSRLPSSETFLFAPLWPSLVLRGRANRTERCLTIALQLLP